MRSRTAHKLVVTCLYIALLAIPAAHAQGYPDRPVRLIVPFAAGGAIDILGRTVSQELAQRFGQSIIIDNRPGGGTAVGTLIAVRSTPDGYTLLLSNIALAINPAVRKSMPYDAFRELVPIALLATQSFAITASNTFAPRTIAELIALAKQQPGKIVYGMAGVGSGGHIAGELFKSMAMINLTHVGYKGGALVVNDLLANQIPLGVTGFPNVVPHMKAGRLKILAITDSKRSQLAPDVPTASETVSGYEFINWFGVLVPSGTPTQVVSTLEKHLLTIMEQSDTRQRLVNGGFEVFNRSGRDFARLLRQNTDTYAKVVKEANIKVDF